MAVSSSNSILVSLKDPSLKVGSVSVLDQCVIVFVNPLNSAHVLVFVSLFADAPMEHFP